MRGRFIEVHGRERRSEGFHVRMRGIGEVPAFLSPEFEHFIKYVLIPEIVAQPVRGKDEDIICSDRKSEGVRFYRKA